MKSFVSHRYRRATETEPNEFIKTMTIRIAGDMDAIKGQRSNLGQFIAVISSDLSLGRTYRNEGLPWWTFIRRSFAHTVDGVNES